MSEKEQVLQNNLNHTIFSWSKQSGLNPIPIQRADGVYVYDFDDKKYIDFSYQLKNVNIGHGNKKVLDAVKKQMEDFSYVYPGMVSKARGDLGKKLAEISPGTLNRSFFTNGGAEAIENAIKLARIYTGRYKIISRYRSYHGATYGAISAGGDPRKLDVDQMSMPGIVHVEDPYCYRCPWGQSIDSCKRECVAHIERVIEFEGPQNVAAILMEGESGSSGCIKYPPDYWKKIKALADKHGILIIDDEVMSGFGRCGKWFAIENGGVVPDIIACAKGITSGYLPLGAIIVKEEICKAFGEKPLQMGLTTSAHAVACAAAVACISVYEEQNLIENCVKMEKYFVERVNKMKDKHPSIGDFRITGLLGAIELVKNRETKEPVTPWNASADKMAITNQMSAKIRKLGMFTFVRWNWIFIAPPLCITEKEADEGLDILSQTIKIADESCK